MNIEKFENRVENIDLDNITQDDVDLIKEIIQKLDNGEIRVVEKIDNEWVVNVVLDHLVMGKFLQRLQVIQQLLSY